MIHQEAGNYSNSFTKEVTNGKSSQHKGQKVLAVDAIPNMDGDHVIVAQDPSDDSSQLFTFIKAN